MLWGTFWPCLFLLQAQWALGKPWPPTQAFDISLRVPDQDSAPLAHLGMSECHSCGPHCAVIACLNDLVQIYNALHHLQVTPQILEFPCLFYHIFALAWHLLTPTRTLCSNRNPRASMLCRPVQPILPLLIIFFCHGSSLFPALDSSMATFSVRQEQCQIPS